MNLVEKYKYNFEMFMIAKDSKMKSILRNETNQLYRIGNKQDRKEIDRFLRIISTNSVDKF